MNILGLGVRGNGGETLHIIVSRTLGVAESGLVATVRVRVESASDAWVRTKGAGALESPLAAGVVGGDLVAVAFPVGLCAPVDAEDAGVNQTLVFGEVTVLGVFDGGAWDPSGWGWGAHGRRHGCSERARGHPCRWGRRGIRGKGGRCSRVWLR